MWHPEYANWMLEATPGQPYRETMADLLEVESNMVMRRKCIRESPCGLLPPLNDA